MIYPKTLSWEWTLTCLREHFGHEKGEKTVFAPSVAILRPRTPKEGTMPMLLQRVLILVPVVVATSLAAIGCGDSRRGGSDIAPVNTGTGYVATVGTITTTRLEAGLVQLFSINVTAKEDLLLEKLHVKLFGSSGIQLLGYEVRRADTSTLINSVTNFQSPPIFPIEDDIPLNLFMRRDEIQTLVFYVHLRVVPRETTMHGEILGIIGRSSNRGLPLDPLPGTLIGPIVRASP